MCNEFTMFGASVRDRELSVGTYWVVVIHHQTVLRRWSKKLARLYLRIIEAGNWIIV